MPPPISSLRSDEASSFYREAKPFLGAVWGVLIVSFFTTISYVAVPLYFEQIADRVLTGRNLTTLALLTAITLAMLLAYAVLDAARRAVLRRAADGLDLKLSGLLLGGLNRARSGRADLPTPSTLADLDLLRDFLGGRISLSAFDAIWSPLFLIVLFLIHPAFALLALLLVAASGLLLVATAWLTAKDRDQQLDSVRRKQQLSSMLMHDADTLRVMGMLPRLVARWRGIHGDGLGWQQSVESTYNSLHSIVNFLRNGQPVFVQCLGAYLFLQGSISSGAFMATMVILYRIVGPIDGLILNWETVIRARQAVGRLDALLRADPAEARKISLPRPKGALHAIRVSLTPPGAKEPVLHDVSVRVLPGRILGIAGPSGAGKSCLARVLVGAWRPDRGAVTLGEHDLSHWNADELGAHAGYVPQDIILLPGSLADNISRFEPDDKARSERLLAACGAAGLGDLLQVLPQGLNTRVGEAGGWTFSAGQLQRVALARALYGAPHLLVMDEPNSHLDVLGEQALIEAIMKLREAGAVIAVVSHKMTLLRVCDDIVVMNNGVVQASGSREEVFASLARTKSLLPSQQLR